MASLTWSLVRPLLEVVARSLLRVVLIVRVTLLVPVTGGGRGGRGWAGLLGTSLTVARLKIVFLGAVPALRSAASVAPAWLVVGALVAPASMAAVSGCAALRVVVLATAVAVVVGLVPLALGLEVVVVSFLHLVVKSSDFVVFGLLI